MQVGALLIGRPPAEAEGSALRVLHRPLRPEHTLGIAVTIVATKAHHDGFNPCVAGMVADALLSPKRTVLSPKPLLEGSMRLIAWSQWELGWDCCSKQHHRAAVRRRFGLRPRLVSGCLAPSLPNDPTAG